MNRTFTIPLAIIVGGVIVAGAVYFSITSRVAVAPTGVGNPSLVRPVGSDDHILGNPAAPVKIVEYSDFDCTYCKGFDTTLHQLIANDGANGSVAWVYREFPLTEIHPDAMKNAEAAECAAVAGGNDAFWKFSDLLFANQPANSTNFGAYAQAAGASPEAFANCYANASTTVAARILADRKNAIAVGAQGTPYSLIIVAGKAPTVMNGAYSYDALKSLVDQALQSVSSTSPSR